MKKKKAIVFILGIICIFIVLICVLASNIFNNRTKELKKENKKYSELIVKTKSGQKIETNYMRFDDSNFYLKFPIKFKRLDSNDIKKKYVGNVAGFVYSNTEGNINVVVNITENKMMDSQIDAYKDYMKDFLKTTSEIIDSNLYEVDNHSIGQLKLISKAIDTDIYNNMIFFSYNDKLVIVTFNCTMELKEEWQNVGDFIIQSLFFKE